MLLPSVPVRHVPIRNRGRRVVDQLRGMLPSPEVMVATWRSARSEIVGLAEGDVREALDRLDPLWNQLFPAEKARIVRLLVERVDVGTEGIDILLRTAGLASLAGELRADDAGGRIAA
jgi:site-specific DNA recombinase